MMLEYARYRRDYSTYHRDWKWQTLDTACDELGVEVESTERHRAIGDALSCLGIMRTLAERSGTHPVSEARLFE